MSLACVLLVDILVLLLVVHIFLAWLSGFFKNSQASGVIYTYIFYIIK